MKPPQIYATQFDLKNQRYLLKYFSKDLQKSVWRNTG